MADFKDLYNAALLQQLSEAFQRASADFPEDRFVAAAQDLSSMELKARVIHIAKTLRACLPEDFKEATGTMHKALDLFPHKDGQKAPESPLQGFAIWPLARFVALYGAEDLGTSMDLLYRLTQRFSAEFAVRPFLIHNQQETLEVLTSWAKDSNKHVRRLVSEGTRPRLPWGIQLPAFCKDPSPVLPLLHALKNDPEEYVRRSVANHLNDITKDNPGITLDFLESWQTEEVDHPKHRAWVTRHALRTLLKAGNPRALGLLGYNPDVNLSVSWALNTPAVHMGGALEFEANIVSQSNRAEPLMIDYAVHHKKANGELKPKVFKLSKQTLQPGTSTQISRKHKIKKITTRRYYAGEHRVELLINGTSYGTQDFTLIL